MSLGLLSHFANNMYTTTYTTTTTSSNGGVSAGLIVFYIALIVIFVAAVWRVFDKAKQPGWAALIPIYNTYVLLKAVNRPGWWLLLYFIPIVNLVIHLIVSIDLAKAFGKDTTFGVIAIWIFSIVGYLMLGYGSATYKGAPKRA